MSFHGRVCASALSGLVSSRLVANARVTLQDLDNQVMLGMQWNAV